MIAAIKLTVRQVFGYGAELQSGVIGLVLRSAYRTGLLASVDTLVTVQRLYWEVSSAPKLAILTYSVGYSL